MEYTQNTETTQNKSNFDITISNKNNIPKIIISDYISIEDFVKRMKSIDTFHLLDLLCNCILWNTEKQKVNKGIFYIILNANLLYNISFTDKEIKIDERTKIDFDEQTKKENIIEERVITFDINTNEYHYYKAKHYKTSTFYTRYYDKNRLFNLGKLDLSSKETYDEISSVFNNLECINEIENIININMLREYILEDLEKNYQKKIIDKRM